MLSLKDFKVTQIGDPVKLNEVKGGLVSSVTGGGSLGNGVCYEDIVWDNGNTKTEICYAKDGLPREPD